MLGLMHFSGMFCGEKRNGNASKMDAVPLKSMEAKMHCLDPFQKPQRATTECTFLMIQMQPSGLKAGKPAAK